MTRPIRKICLAIIVAAALGACGGRQGTITTVRELTTTVHGALQALQTTFVDWDRQHQLDLVAAATSKEDGAAQLAAYQIERRKVVEAFAVGYTAVIAVAVTLPLVEIGRAQPVDLTKLLIAAVDATQKIQAAIAAIQGAVP